MSKKTLRYPTSQRQGEQGATHVQTQYQGMLYNSCPPQKIPLTHSFWNVNVIDRGDWYECRTGTRLIGGEAYTIEGALCYNEKWGQIVKCGVFVDAMYILDTDLTTRITINMFGLESSWLANPVGIEFDDETIALIGGIWRINQLSATSYYAYQLNSRLPAELIDDIVSGGGGTFEYRYAQSFARIEGGSVNDGRIDTDNGAVLVLETGTGKEETREFTEVWYAAAVSAANTEQLDPLSVPVAADTCHITHHSLYRTMEIDQGAADPRYFTWVEDVPVAKAITGTIVGNALTKSAGSNDFVLGDRGCVLRDDVGGVGTIATVTSSDVVQLQAGHTLGAGLVYVAIGAGFVLEITQVGNVVTDANSNFLPTHVTPYGQEIFYSDGTRALVTGYTNTSTVTVNVSKAIAITESATIGLVIGTRFERKWTDTVLDDAVDGDEGLYERQLSERDLYIPLFGYQPMPNANVGKIASGFLLTGVNDESKFYYCGIGAKKYSMGQYQPFYQYEDLDKPLTEILISESVAIMALNSALRYVSLAVTTDAGNANVGESIAKLFPSSSLDENVGIPTVSRGTITKVSRNLWLAMTGEPGVRELTSLGWGSKNFMVDDTGYETVHHYFRTASNITYPFVSWYSQVGGYKIQFDRTVPDPLNPGGLINISTCLRYAYLPTQGIGWTFCVGENWVIIKGFNSRVSFTKNGIERVFLADRSDGETFEDSTFDPRVHTKPAWVDKEGLWDKEITWEKWYREIGDENVQEHLLTKFLTRPQIPSNKGDSDYDDNGYRAAQQIDLECYVDGALTRAFATLYYIPENGDVHFGGNKVVGRQFMFVVKGAASEIIVTDTKHWLLNKNKQGSRTERTMQSNTFGALLANKSFCVTRDLDLLYERVGQETIPGTVTAITGPDSRDRSAMELVAITPLSNPAIVGAWTVVYWRKTVGGATIPALAPMTQYGDAFDGWGMWYKTGINLAENFLVINPGAAFDINIYPADVSETFDSIYNDVRYNGGNVYLPNF